MWALTRTGKAQLAISCFFFTTGASLGNWAALLPFVKVEQDLSNGVLGLVLLAAVGGAICALPTITYMGEKLGTGPSLVISSLSSFLFFPLIGVPHQLGVFVVGVFFIGVTIGGADVSMNSHAVLCEKMTRKPHLGGFHAMFAMGGFVGALMGGALVGRGISVLQEACLFAILMGPWGVASGCWLFSLGEERLINRNGLVDYQAAQYDKVGGGEGEQSNPLLYPGSFAYGGVPGQEDDVSLRSHLLFGDSTLSMSASEREEREDRESDLNSSFNDSEVSGRLRQSADGLGQGAPGTLTEGARWSEGAGVAGGTGVARGGARSTDKGHVDWQVYEVREAPESGTWDCCCPTPANPSPSSPTPTKCVLLLISLVCFLALFAEGAVSDWSGIYFTDELSAPPLTSTLGYAGFQIMLALGGLGSDYLVMRMGRRMLLQISGLVAAVGMGVVVATPSLVDVHKHTVQAQVLTVIGFSLVGLGTSSVGPSAVSLAGSHAVAHEAGMTSAESIAYVTSIGYLGIMVSPPILGGLSVALHGLRWSFAVTIGFLLGVSIVCSVIKREVFTSYKSGMGQRPTAGEEVQ